MLTCQVNKHLSISAQQFIQNILFLSLCPDKRETTERLEAAELVGDSIQHLVDTVRTNWAGDSCSDNKTVY